MKRDKVAVCDLCAMEQQDAQERYDKAMEYAERAIHIDGELDQEKLIRIASGLNK